MPWSEACLMDLRASFVAACVCGDEPMNHPCARYAISRKTGYKWLARYRQAGLAGLMARSPARHTQPPGVPPAVSAAVLALRAQRPSWGPRKLLARLAADQPETTWPAASTLGDLLRREGLSKPRPARRTARAEQAPLAAPGIIPAGLTTDRCPVSWPGLILPRAHISRIFWPCGQSR